MNLICPRCGYKSTIYSNLLRHLRKNKVCTPFIKDISRESAINLLRIEYNKNNKRPSKYATKKRIINDNVKLHKNIEKKTDTNIKLQEAYNKLKEDHYKLKNEYKLLKEYCEKLESNEL